MSSRTGMIYRSRKWNYWDSGIAIFIPFLSTIEFLWLIRAKRFIPPSCLTFYDLALSFWLIFLSLSSTLGHRYLFQISGWSLKPKAPYFSPIARCISLVMYIPQILLGIASSVYFFPFSRYLSILSATKTVLCVFIILRIFSLKISGKANDFS